MINIKNYKTIFVPKLKHDGLLYYNESRDITESIIPTSFKSNHASCMLETCDGNLLCVWFAGSDEGNADISIVRSIFDCKKGQWEKAEQITFDSNRSEQNPSLFQHPNGEIWLLYTAQLARQKAKEEFFNLQYTSEIRRKVSKDQGRTWSDYDIIFERPGSFCRQPIQILSNGRFIFANWICFNDKSKNGTDISVMQISDDQGKTWHSVEVPQSQGKVHANIVEVDKGRLLAFFRSRSADNIYVSESIDYGDTWSVPQRTELNNNNSSISAIKLSGNRIAIAFNDIKFNDDPNIILWPYERPQITIAISEDEGKTFPIKRIAEFGDGFVGKDNLRSNHRYEYPYLFQDKDGNIHLSYSYHNRIGIKHQIFTEEWVYGQPQKIEGDCKLWK